MKKVLMVLAAALVLSLGLWARPASAHNQDAYTEFYCAKHAGGSNWTIVHSFIDWYNDDVVEVYCMEQFFDVKRQYWVWVACPWPTSNNSVLVGDYQPCRPYGYVTCGVPGN